MPLVLHRIYTGTEFNELAGELVLVKLTNEHDIHNKFPYYPGLNNDILEFNPNGECQKGGLYFIAFRNFAKWVYYGKQKMKYILDVTITDDAKVYVESNKFKADKIIISNKRKIKDLDVWNDEENCLNAVKHNIQLVKYVSYGHNACEYAIEHDDYRETIPNPDYYPSRYWKSPKYINRFSTPVKQLRSYVINYIPIGRRTHDMYELVLKRDYRYMSQIPDEDQTEDIQLYAIDVCWDAIRYINNPTVRALKAAIEKNINAMVYIIPLTPEELWDVMGNGQYAGTILSKPKYAEQLIPSGWMYCLERDGVLLKHMHEQTEEACLVAVTQNWRSLRFVKNKTEAICTAALKQSPEAKRYFPKTQPMEVELRPLVRSSTSRRPRTSRRRRRRQTHTPIDRTLQGTGCGQGCTIL